jgi:hypothetical protein
MFVDPSLCGAFCLKRAYRRRVGRRNRDLDSERFIVQRQHAVRRVSVRVHLPNLFLPMLARSSQTNGTLNASFRPASAEPGRRNLSVRVLAQLNAIPLNAVRRAPASFIDPLFRRGPLGAVVADNAVRARCATTPSSSRATLMAFRGARHLLPGARAGSVLKAPCRPDRGTATSRAAAASPANTLPMKNSRRTG